MAELEYAPIPRRFFHFAHLICIVGLTISGLYIRFPFYQGGMTFMKWAHYVLMYVVGVNLILRIIYCFFTVDKSAYRDLAIGWKDIKNTPNVLMYYGYIKDDYPHVAKYASMQKMTYDLFWVLLFIQGFTGFSLMWREQLLSWCAGPFGGVAIAAAWMRVFHYIGMWIFVIFTTIHAHLSIQEGYPIMKHWIFWITPPWLKGEWEEVLKKGEAHH
ncbi:MAG TPA: hypothetical protein DCW86_00175 [Actinobacteria bacterium]|nr:hypothetical protein [Actinomycetota bacterium]